MILLGIFSLYRDALYPAAVPERVLVISMDTIGGGIFSISTNDAPLTDWSSRRDTAQPILDTSARDSAS